MSLIKKADVKAHFAAKHRKNHLLLSFAEKSERSTVDSDHSAAAASIGSQDKLRSSDSSDVSISSSVGPSK